MKRNLLLVLSCALISLFITSCEKTPGCMDIYANNYNVDADEDDGSCIYNGDVQFLSTYDSIGLKMRIDLYINESSSREGRITSRTEKSEAASCDFNHRSVNYYDYEEGTYTYSAVFMKWNTDDIAYTDTFKMIGPINFTIQPQTCVTVDVQP